MDSGKVVAPRLLDLSAAFDLIADSILHDYIKYYFGVDGTVLTWIDCYITNPRKLERRGVF